jgi:non-ribosomal peptide synthetase-like protein
VTGPADHNEEVNARHRKEIVSRTARGLLELSMFNKYGEGLLVAAGSSTAEAGPAGATNDVERGLAQVLAGVLNVGSVSVDSHFFDDLSADSMVMARFCARVRKRGDLPSVSMQDIYQHSTIRALAASLAGRGPGAGRPEPAPVAGPAPVVGPPVPPPTEVTEPVKGVAHVLCGVLQLLFFLVYAYLATLVLESGFVWILAASGLVDVYVRSVLFGAASFAVMCVLPILLKWVLVGRWKPQEIRVWSLAYFRFWLVKTLIQRNPMALFVGSPLYAVYLRALGAKIGRGAVILSKNVPVCTDMLRVGDGAVIRKDSFFTGYRAHKGVIQTGAVSVGRDALVGEVTVLDIWTSLGDGAQLGHSSSLHSGQTVPHGERWHGSPAQRTDVDYRRVPSLGVGSWRRVVFVTVQLVNLLLLGLPLAVGGVTLALTAVPQFAAVLAPGPVSLTSWAFYRDALVLSGVLFFGSVLVGLVFVGTVPRVLNLFIRPYDVYPLYGFHYWVQRAIARTTNRKFYNKLFGDSSYIVHYLRWIGYDLRNVEQTGSNFGEAVQHDTPFLSAVGSGTVIADGLSIINADFSSTSFRLSRVSIGAHNFLGNRIAYPAQGKTGDNCLLATKLMVPVDGPVREGVGLLGAPSFAIPRSVERDKQLDLGSKDELRRRLRAKNVHNTVTMVLFLLVRWIYLSGVTVLYMVALDLWASMGALAVAVATIGAFFFGVVHFVVVDRLFRPLQALRPWGCSIYDQAFWRHERFWKICSDAYLQLFNGTPYKTVIWRLLGVRIGRRVFDDGLFMTERSFTAIGDGCTFNAGSVIQCHSQEDGGFKSDRTAIGAGCTLGVGAFVHYGVTMGDGAVLAADSFLMKGEEMPPREQWGGNPAKMSKQSADFWARRIGVGGVGAGRVHVPDGPTRPVRRGGGGVRGGIVGVGDVHLRVPDGPTRPVRRGGGVVRGSVGVDDIATVRVRVPDGPTRPVRRGGSGVPEDVVGGGAGRVRAVPTRPVRRGGGGVPAGADDVATVRVRVPGGPVRPGGGGVPEDVVGRGAGRVRVVPPRPVRRGGGGVPAGADDVATVRVRAADGPPRPVRRSRGGVPAGAGADGCKACGKH